MAFKNCHGTTEDWEICRPVIRHSLLNYRNDFLANEKSKNQSFYELAKSNLNTEVIEYLVVFSRHRGARLNFPIDENSEVYNLLQFYLEYMIVNQPIKSYMDCRQFLYFAFFPPFGSHQNSTFAYQKASEILDSIKKKGKLIFHRFF